MNRATKAATATGAGLLAAQLTCAAAILALNGMDHTQAGAAAGPVAAAVATAVALAIMTASGGMRGDANTALGMALTFAGASAGTLMLGAPAYIGSTPWTGLPLDRAAELSLTFTLAVMILPAALLYIFAPRANG